MPLAHLERVVLEEDQCVIEAAADRRVAFRVPAADRAHLGWLVEQVERRRASIEVGEIPQELVDLRRRPVAQEPG